MESERHDMGPAERKPVPACLALALLLFASACVLRGSILFSGQQYLRSDEAVVGLMAKHIVTEGERPLFLYGQPYGGGHAMVAYIAAPLFALFGRSAIILTGVTTAVSLLNVLLLWWILRRWFNEWIAVAGAGLYAFSPPVAYQAFLVNGGTESFCLALVALAFFLRAYLDGRRPLLNAALAGLFTGMAYYAMDYALLYAVTFCALWAATGRTGKWRCLGLFIAGFAVGCLPLIVFNLTHDFAHLKQMFTSQPGQGMGMIPHVFGALWGALSGDLAAFFSGEIDDFKREAVGMGSWLHATAAILAVLALLIEHRGRIGRVLRHFSLRGRESAPLPPAIVPLAFIVIYMAMYCVARFSLPTLRTPRYFLPLCPFVSVAIALALLWKRQRFVRQLGGVLIAALILRGIFVSVDFGTRTWHEEHHIRTAGPEVALLADWLKEHDVRTAYAPYEIQWRLMFASDESVLVANDLISPWQRYPRYSEAVRQRVAQGENVALIFQQNLLQGKRAFGSLVRGPAQDSQGNLILYRMALKRALLRDRMYKVGDEFVVVYPVSPEMLGKLVLGDNAGAPSQ